jgi:hypothetical protein
MRRREFLALTSGVIVGCPLAMSWSLSAEAQPALPVVGYLGAESPSRMSSRVSGVVHTTFSEFCRLENVKA